MAEQSKPKDAEPQARTIALSKCPVCRRNKVNGACRRCGHGLTGARKK